MSLQIWVPSGADVGEREVVAGVDTTRQVVDRCRICDWPLLEGEPEKAMELHLRRCVVENHDKLMAERERQHPTIMQPWDPEFHRWIREHGPAVLEGRLKP